MARKKRTSASGKKKPAKKVSGWIVSLKRLFYMACFVVVMVAAALYVYQVAEPYIRDWDWGKLGTEKIKEEICKQTPSKNEPQETTKNVSEPTKKSAPSRNASAELLKDVELPECGKGTTQQVIQHEGYTVSYNSDYRVANWVFYELTSAEAKSKDAERSNHFVRDPQVKGASAEDSDYKHTGYDRGHLAPAGDMRWSETAMKESFYFSNITPQKPGLNRGIWKELEEQCRLWAMDNGFLMIATGPVLSPALKRLGKNQVAIPERFYKVICTIYNGEYEAVGFLLDNRDYGKTPLQSLMISVDSVEQVTQIDFFSSLPDDIECRMEAEVNESAWSF